MIWIIAALSLLVAAADLRFYLRHLARYRHSLRIGFIIVAVVTNLLPFLISGIFFLLPDNSGMLHRVALWGFMVYLITVIPRLTYYFFGHLRLHRTGIVVAVMVVFILLWGALYGRTAIVVNEVEIRSQKLPVAFDGVRIVQFSDLHIGTLVCPKYELRRLVDMINALNPDLVVFSGDLVNIRYTELDESTMRVLSEIKAPLGVFSNIGNHDTGGYIRDTITLSVPENTARLIEREQAMGWRIPDNKTEYLVRDGDTITLSGISFDPSFRLQRHDRELDIDLTPVYENISHKYYNITISHLPQLWEQIMSAGYGDLTLSGHVHAMQMSLNLGSQRFSPARLMYDRWSGLYEEWGKYLYINDGIGYVGFPMRLGAYPEITLFTLKR